MSFEVGAGLYGEDLVGDVGHDLGALVEMNGLGLYLSINRAGDLDRLSYDRTFNFRLFADNDQRALYESAT